MNNQDMTTTVVVRNGMYSDPACPGHEYVATPNTGRLNYYISGSYTNPEINNIHQLLAMGEEMDPKAANMVREGLARLLDLNGTHRAGLMVSRMVFN